MKLILTFFVHVNIIFRVSGVRKRGWMAPGERLISTLAVEGNRVTSVAALIERRHIALKVKKTNRNLQKLQIENKKN